MTLTPEFNKYHSLFAGLSVAFELTCPSNQELLWDNDIASQAGGLDKLTKAFLHRKPRETVQRIYAPAARVYVSENPALVFLPLVSEEYILGNKFHRFCFRDKGGDTGDHVVFAREGEEKTWSCTPLPEQTVGYMTLNFLGYGTTEFAPLFCRYVEKKEVRYACLVPHVVQEGVVLIIHSVAKNQVPEHLRFI
jgi:hypothetical protein